MYSLMVKHSSVFFLFATKQTYLVWKQVERIDSYTQFQVTVVLNEIVIGMSNLMVGSPVWNLGLPEKGPPVV